MRDYWLTKDLLQATGIAFIVLSLSAIALALWLPKKWWGKLLAVAAVCFLISIPVRQGTQEVKQQQVQVDDFKERYAKAKALFEKRCETAGEKIFMTVEGVDSIFLINIKPKREFAWDINQNHIDDLYSNDIGGGGAVGIEATQGQPRPDSYILSFLKPTNPDKAPQEKLKNKEGFDSVYTPSVPIVEDRIIKYSHRIINIKKRVNTSYADWVFGSELLSEERSTKQKPRYGVEWADISTPEDRSNWIAGGRVRVIDLTSETVIGERVGYLFDSGLGSTSGERSPWGWAQSYGPRCPSPSEPTAKFVFKILKSK